ncbi:MAG: hypothetical protein EBZ78_02275 [Verrucomicrobia bacterium]|nr:hypothetical protein [Verrucomicrobiota bacterium]
MYVDMDKAVAEALSMRVGALEKRVGLLESRMQSHPSPDDGIEGGTDFKKACTTLGFTEKQILSHDRTGELQDARYQIARILIRGGLTVREISRIMRRSCRSIQRMI